MIQGWDVYAGVRRTEDGEDVRQGHPNIYPVILDVTSADSVASACQQVGQGRSRGDGAQHLCDMSLAVMRSGVCGRDQCRFSSLCMSAGGSGVTCNGRPEKFLIILNVFIADMWSASQQ